LGFADGDCLPGYDVATSAQNGAVGGTILFLVLCLSWVIFGAMQTDEPRSCGFGILHYLGGLSFTVGFAAACGAVGSAVLIATGHAVQQVTESAIAGAVGAATLAAGVMAFYLLLFPLLCCYWVDPVDGRTTVSYTTTVEHPSYSRW
jgi:hypothetical protein